MMNQYETVFIVNPVLSEADYRHLAHEYVNLLKENKAQIIEEKNWGMRQLAYPIQKKNSGFYYLIEYKATGETVNKLEIELKRDENVLRFLTTHLDKYAIQYNERKRKGETGTKKQQKLKTVKEEV